VNGNFTNNSGANSLGEFSVNITVNGTNNNWISGKSGWSV
jgi:hypothetical protein